MKFSLSSRLTPFLIVLAIFSACKKNDGYIRCEGMVWNTLYHITYDGPENLEDSIAVVMNRINSSLSVFDPQSKVSQLNASDSLAADRMLFDVYNMSVKINEVSHGMFDPTLSPLITAWGFGPGHKATADTARVDSILDFVGLRKTRIENMVIYKDDPRICFNFSAIAKGYGCDEVGEMFRRNGVLNYMIEIGGEIALSGKAPSGNDWKISIDVPDSDNLNHDAFTVVELTDCGIATSGNYRNFRNEGGRLLAHTISPVDGRPVVTDIISATVIAPQCMEADAVATACMASGLTKSKEMLEDLQLDALLILTDSVWCTPGFEKLVIAKASEPENIGRD